MVLLLVRFVTHGYSSGLLFPLGDSFRSCAVHLFYQHVRVPSACFLLPLPALRRVRASAGLADAATGSKTGSSRARARFLGRRCVRNRSSSPIHLYALRRAMPRQGQHRHSQYLASARSLTHNTFNEIGLQKIDVDSSGSIGTCITGWVVSQPPCIFAWRLEAWFVPSRKRSLHRGP